MPVAAKARCRPRPPRDDMPCSRTAWSLHPGRARHRRSRIIEINNLENEMSVGTVKWFNPSKGYGFIEPSDGGKDVFIHISALERAGIGSLNEGQKIEYEVVVGRNGKSAADNVKLAD